jgi:hypothetical protein
MNTQKSQAKANDFLENGPRLKRKTQVVRQKFSHSAQKVFHQFCPSRELDWIQGWECDLLFSSSGYAEKDCIFTTPQSNAFGPGLWVFTSFELNRELGLVVFSGDVVEHIRITLEEHEDGTCTGTLELDLHRLEPGGQRPGRIHTGNQS